MKEILNGNAEPITQLFDGGDRRSVVAPADDIVHDGLSHTASGTQRVDGNTLFLTQL